MGFRDAATIRTSAIQFIDLRLSGMRTEAGEPIVDLIDSFATETARFFVMADYLRRINSIAGWLSVVSDDAFKASLADAMGVSAVTLNPTLARQLAVPNTLSSDVEAIVYFDLNRFAESFGQPRHLATAATATERFYLSSSAPYTLLRGAVVKTPGTRSVSYSTNDDLIAATPAFDAVVNAYFVSVGVKCQTLGSAGNQIVGAIRAAGQNIPGVLRVTNVTPAEGGIPEETNTQLLDRLQGSFTGQGIDSLNGLRTFILNQGAVQDVLVVGPGDPLMIRSIAGAVDIYVIGSQLTTASARTVIANAGEAYRLPYQPLRQFNAAQDITVPATFVPGTGMELSIDTANFADSSKANDRILWDSITGPQPGDTVVVSYTYNSLLRNIQNQLDNDPTRDIPAADVLLKEGIQLGLVLSMKVVVVPGNDQLTVEQAVLDNMTTFLSAFKFKQPANFSTLETQAGNTTIDGIKVVDHIDNFMLAINGSALDVVDVVPGRNQYLRLFDISFLSETGTVI